MSTEPGVFLWGLLLLTTACSDHRNMLYLSERIKDTVSYNHLLTQMCFKSSRGRESPQRDGVFMCLTPVSLLLYTHYFYVLLPRVLEINLFFTGFLLLSWIFFSDASKLFLSFYFLLFRTFCIFIFNVSSLLTFFYLITFFFNLFLNF